MSGVHLLAISDLHCGHLFGLTSPQFQLTPTQAKTSRFRQKAYDWQQATWDWYAHETAQAQALLGPFAHVVCNGDAIEGKGERSGSTELLTADRNEQVAIAADVISSSLAPRVTIVRGTPSHTGMDEDWEDVLAQQLGTQAQDRAWLEHAGIVLDFKHHIGSTSVPGAIPPALGREAIWNLLWAEKDLQPKSTIIVRSHLHKFCYVGDENYLAMVTPALQGWTKYGAKRMSKTISFGFVTIYIDDSGDWEWEQHILVPTFAKAVAEQI